MVTKNTNRKFVSSLFAVLLIASALMLIAMTASVSATNSIESSTSVYTGYGDPNQEKYAYPIGPGGDSGNTFFNPGPAPNTPNVKWIATAASLGLPGSSVAAGGVMIEGMAGKLITYCGNNLVAINPQTGQKIWNNTSFGTPRGFGTGYYFQVDATHFGYEISSGIQIHSLIDGSRTGYIAFSAANVSTAVPYSGISGSLQGVTSFGGGSVMYWGGFYDSYDSIKITTANTGNLGVYQDWLGGGGRNITGSVHLGLAFKCNPNSVTVAWTKVFPTGVEALGSSPGVVYFGGYGEGQIWALNATNGAQLWTAWKTGNAGYACNYYEGKVYQSASSTRLTCWNATTGELIFDREEGARAFFVFGDALAYGMYIGKNIALPNSYIGAWDANTGVPLWKVPALYNIAYLTPVVADGKVYVTRYQGTAGGEQSFGNQFCCLDAFTGQILWQLPGLSTAAPSVAYGNLYFIANSQLYCIGDDYSSGGATQSYPSFHAWTNTQGLSSAYPHDDYPGVVSGQPAPASLTLQYAFGPVGPITGSAVADNGRVYFGSLDSNIYCMNATNGASIWNYTLGYRIASTPCLYGGVLYTGTDDGSIHALDAITGRQLWTADCGGKTQILFSPAWQGRSSPMFDGAGHILVGALDGNLYCFNTGGTLAWKSAAGNATFPIGGSPCIVNASVYIMSTDGKLYAFSMATGAQLWNTTMQSGTRQNIGTPVYDRGFLWIGAGATMLCRVNATDGVIYNMLRLPFIQGSGGSTPAITQVAVWHTGSQYYLFSGDGMQEDCFNITTFIYGNGVNGYNGTYYTSTGRYSNPGGAYIDATGYHIVPSDTMNGNTTAVNRSGALMINGTYGGNPSGTPSGIYYFDKTLNRYVNANASTLNNQQTNGTLIKPVCNETHAPLLWARWLGHQIYSSSIFVNDLQGPKMYLGDDVFSITAINASVSINASQVPSPGGATIGEHTTGGPIFSSPCIYNDTVFMGSEDGYMFAFRDPIPTFDMNIFAASSKSDVMWNNETLSIAGKLMPNPMTYLDDRGRMTNLGNYESGGMPNATVVFEVVNPDGTSTPYNLTTDNHGYFTYSINPTTPGNYSWLCYFTGANKNFIVYNQAYTSYNTIEVVQAPAVATPEPTQAPTEVPTETPTVEPTPVVTETPTVAPSETAAPSDNTVTYAAIAVIIIVVIAVAAYMFMRGRSKKA